MSAGKAQAPLSHRLVGMCLFILASPSASYCYRTLVAKILPCYTLVTVWGGHVPHPEAWCAYWLCPCNCLPSLSIVGLCCWILSKCQSRGWGMALGSSKWLCLSPSLQHTEALLYGFQSIAETIDVNYSDVVPGLIGLIPRISISNVQLADTVMFTIGEALAHAQAWGGGNPSKVAFAQLPASPTCPSFFPQRWKAN